MRVKAVLLAVLALLFSCGIAFAGDLISLEARTYYNEAVSKQIQGRLDEAATLYKKALLIRNDSPYMKFIKNNLAIICFEKKDLSRAEELFSDSLKLDPRRTAVLNLALFYEKKPDRAKAIEAKLRILGINLESMKSKEYIIFQIGDLKGNNILISDSKKSEAQKFILNNEGIVLAEQNKLSLAQKKFEEALKLDHGYKTAQYNLGLVYDKGPDKLKVQEYWLKLLKLEDRKLEINTFIVDGALK